MNWRYLIIPILFLLSANSHAEPLKIMPLGDSITQGVGNDYPKARGLDSYRRPLYLKLKAAEYDVDFVGSMTQTYECGDPANDDFDPNHEGHWRWRADEIIVGKNSGCRGSGRISQWLKEYSPDIALIHLGTNDMFDRQPVASTIKELGIIIEIIREYNPEVVVFLAKLLPAKDPERGKRIIALNQEIHKVVEQKHRPESPVILVDHFSDFDVDKEMFDGVHPNLAGEEKMAQRWFDAIEDYLKSKTK